MTTSYLRWWRLSADRSHLYAGTEQIPYQVVVPPVSLTARTTRVRGKYTYTPPPTGTRADLVLGVDMPTPATTGLLPGWGIPGSGAASILTEAPAAISTYADTTTAIKTIQNTWFTGRVSITGRHYRFVNCFFQGDWANAASPVIAQNVNNLDNVFESCRFEPQSVTWNSPAITGWQFELKYCHILHCSDGIAHIGQGANYTGLAQNIKVTQSLFQLGAYMSPDPGANGGLPDNQSHLDLCAQTRGGTGFTFQGNALWGFVETDGSLGVGEGWADKVILPSGTHVTGYNDTGSTGPGAIPTGVRFTLSLFMFSPALGTWDDVDISYNWLDGAAYMFNAANTSLVFGPNVKISHNNIGRVHMYKTGILLAKAATTFEMTDNKYFYDLTSTPPDDGPLTVVKLGAGGAGLYRHMYTGARSTWPDANLRTNG